MLTLCISSSITVPNWKSYAFPLGIFLASWCLSWCNRGIFYKGHMSQTGQPVAGCSMQYAPEKNSFQIWAGWSPCILFYEWMSEWMTIRVEIWSCCKIPAIRVPQGACVHTRGISALLGKQRRALGNEGVGTGLLPSWIGKPELYLHILIIRLENTEVRAGRSPTPSLGAGGWTGAGAGNFNKLESKICPT